MEIQFGPNPIDAPNLLYKLQSATKVFGSDHSLPKRGYNLVASSSKYGLVFVGVPTGTLSIYHLHELIDNESEPLHMSISLPEKPTYVSVNCDYELLAVTGGKTLCIYKVTDFQNAKVAPIKSITIKRDSDPPTFVSSIQWNPCIPDSIALAFHDGTLSIYQTSTGQGKSVATKARCLCWSPKGKQLVTGNSDGTLHQFKPDLTPVKAIPSPPDMFDGAPVEVLAVYWVSTFQFSVVYRNAADDSRPSVSIVDAPKGAKPFCIFYEDICYSIGFNRPWFYYLYGFPQWNIILTASSNSMELATLGTEDGKLWLPFTQPDEARPELPLTDKNQENYPVGVCIDLCAIHQLPWGENETLPHMPLLHVVSHTGLLTIFNVINTKKELPQLCVPLQQLKLPAEAMISQLLDEIPKAAEPASAPVPEVKPQPTPTPVSTMPQQPASIFSTAAKPPAAPIKVPSFTPQSAIATPLVPDSKPVEKSALAAQLQTTVTQPKPQPAFSTELPKQPAQTQPTQPTASPRLSLEDEALKAEQDKINKDKINQELKNMLVKEVNDFQNELYKFMLKTRETQARIQRDIESINSNFNFNSPDTAQLKKECSIDELRSAIVQLKLELVRACAVIAEARTHSNAREFHQWSQVDPLTTKRVASVKKLAYYVQTQLDQAQKALDYKWSEASREHEHKVPGKHMIRPILDDVYQPLVKQQEILSRQQAVLRTLRKTLNECDIGPVFKTSSLLRSTPFRKKDPLSKLTKNILNMSIEPQNPKQAKGVLSPQKLEALKDALSNHKTVKIRPVNVELRQHFVTMKENYERIVKEKLTQTQAMAAMNKDVKTEPAVQQQAPKYKHAAPLHTQPKMGTKMEIKQEPVRQVAVKHSISAPSITPVDSMKAALAATNVARTLFTEEPKQEETPQQAAKPFSFSQQATTTTSDYGKSALKGLLQSKLGTPPAKDNKNVLTHFGGHNICSPNEISAPKATTTPSPFATKPVSESSNIFGKLPTPTFEAKALPTPTFEAKTLPTSTFEAKTQPTLTFDAKPQPFATKSTLESKPKIHSETGEPETNDPPKALDFKTNKSMTNLFGMKPTATSTPVPDVLKSAPSIQTVKSTEKTPESKENVPKSDDVTVQKTDNKEIKPFGLQTANKCLVFGTQASSNSSPSNEPKQLDLRAENKSSESTAEKSDKVTTTESQVTSTTTAPKQSLAQTPPKEATPPKSDADKPAESKSPASSIFGAVVASQPKTDGIFSQSSSIFTTTNPPTVFGAKSIFGSTSSTSFGQSPSTQSSASSVFASASEPSSFGSVAAEDSKAVVTPVSTVASTPSSVFGSTSFSTTSVTSSSVFSTTPTSVFGQASGAFAPTTTSLFPTTTASAFEQSVFGTTTQASVFDTTPTASSVFGTAATQAFGNTTPTTQTGSIFGSPTTQASIFGTATSTQSVFGTPTTQASVFGTPTTQASIFGSPTQTTQTSVFGTPTPTTQTSVFGTPTPTTQASVFGTPTQTTQASVFGTPTQTTQASIFGTPTQTTQASIFGTPTQTTQASVFGTPTQATQASVFGAPASGGLFGSGESNLFASASISSTNAPSGTSGGNIFGGSSTGSVFGGANVFGGKTTFGQSSTTAASIFGGASSFGQQKPATNLWSGGSNETGFGSTTAFGQQTTQASSIFGGGTGGSFSTPSAGAFGTQQPGFGTGESQPSSVFGSPQPQTGTAFGGSPAFGSKPAFGQTAGFGSPTSGGAATGFGAFGGGFNKSPSGFGGPAAFGGGATFGGTAFGNTSPGKVFGGAAPSFGSPNQQSNATFENLASQNTLTFGSLAQSPQQQQPQQSSFNTSPSFTGWRG